MTIPPQIPKIESTVSPMILPGEGERSLAQQLKEEHLTYSEYKKVIAIGENVKRKRGRYPKVIKYKAEHGTLTIFQWQFPVMKKKVANFYHITLKYPRFIFLNPVRCI